MKTADDRQRALERTLAVIEKQFGKGAVMKMGESVDTSVQVVPTGSLSIDIALGVGGIPRGRIIEIYGPESSGKTTVALHCVAEVQKRGGICGYIDAEHALDPVYAKKIGVNIDELYISQPDDGEQALEIAEAMVRSCAIDLVIVDSVAALTPRAEIEGDMGDSHVGLQARLMSQALRKLTGIAKKTNCTIIFINQLREKIGITYGPSETTTGGRALKFYSSVRIDIRKSEWIKQGDEFVGTRTKVKIAKNKVAPPFKVCEFDIMYGKGISRTGDVLDLAVECGIANKSGAWFSYGTVRLGQGRENAKAYLEDYPEICDELEDASRKHFGLPDMESLNKSIRFLTPDDIVIDEPPAKKPAAAKMSEPELTEPEDEELTFEE
ncbi:MAG: recombinase RecA [Defluviitaleaceae bacterium]|nr:recombinase RecA [Defluviitaleaceae bacterium]